MKILHIDSSPQGDLSVSRILSRALVERLTALHPGADVLQLDLAGAPVPHLEPKHLAALFTTPEERTLAQEKLVADSDILVEQLLEADVIVIGVAMINFAVPSTLKAWLDHVIRAGKTFTYNESGPRGLVQGKRVLLAISTGGVYSDGPAKSLDFTEPYLRAVLGFMGMTDVETVRAEGVKLPDNREKAIEAALARVPLAV